VNPIFGFSNILAEDRKSGTGSTRERDSEGGAFVGGVRNGKAFEVSMPGEGTRTFDSFECAMHALAPTCENCGVRVIGHGIEAGGRFFCCAHCADRAGAEGVTDRV
jgi:hypothetical protein